MWRGDFATSSLTSFAVVKRLGVGRNPVKYAVRSTQKLLLSASHITWDWIPACAGMTSKKKHHTSWRSRGRACGKIDWIWLSLSPQMRLSNPLYTSR
jgi:hypothetical protein